MSNQSLFDVRVGVLMAVLMLVVADATIQL